MEEEKTNLWESILHKVAQRDEINESTLLIMGDRGAGKKSLIQTWNKQLVKSDNTLIRVERMLSPFAGLDSAFLYVKDLYEKDALNMNVSSKENLPRLNIWSLRYEEKADLLQVVLKPDDLEHLLAIIVLDFD